MVDNKKIDVKAIIAAKRAAITKQTTVLKESYQLVPTFRVILVGANPASVSYVKAKMKAATEVGIDGAVLEFPDTVSEATLLAEIERLNQDASVHGFIVQLPLPAHINETKILQAVDPQKDIDGFHPVNIGNLMLGAAELVPCTPKGIIEIIKAIDVDLTGKHVVIIGRSNIVGKPVALLALQENATVTICHSKTVDLPAVARTADVLIVAIGREHFIQKEYVREGAIVIDVGVNRSTKTGKLVGDVDYEAVKDTVAAITPVPGGVGPMTVTMLLENTLKALYLQKNIKECDIHATTL